MGSTIQYPATCPSVATAGLLETAVHISPEGLMKRELRSPTVSSVPFILLTRRVPAAAVPPVSAAPSAMPTAMKKRETHGEKEDPKRSKLTYYTL